jgi:hypothetical protein
MSRPTNCQNLWAISFRQLDEQAKEADHDKRLLEKTREKVKEVSYFWVDVSLYVLRK